MKIVWSIRSFLDYRVPVFACLNEISGGKLSVVFPDTRTPDRVRKKIKQELGDNAIEMTGERSLGSKAPSNQLANKSWLFTYQPGLAKTINSLSPDVTIGDGFGQWSVPLLKRRIMKRTPFVLCYERTAHTERSAQATRTLYRKQMCRWVDAACVNGSLTKEFLVSSYGVEESKITTGFMASDSSLASRVADIDRDAISKIRSKYDLNGTTYLSVGRLIDRKGVMPMMNAWNKFVQEGNPNATLALAGEGERINDIKKFCQSNNLENLRVLGRIPYAEIEQLYVASDVMLMPTLEDNWSLVVPEAMSCGLPVINSKYNGCWPELTHDGSTGWVFDPLDPADFLSAIKTAYQHREQLNAMGKQCTEVVSHYTPESAAHAIYQACEIAFKRKQR